MRTLLAALVVVVTQATVVYAEGTNCTNSLYETKLRDAGAKGNFDGRDGATYWLRFIKAECSAERAARAERTVSDMRTAAEKDIVNERQRQREADAKQLAAMKEAEAEARAAEEKRAAEAQIEERKRAADEAKRLEQADQNAWAATEKEACLAPQSLDACKKVADYIHAFPKGKHTDEAKQSLEQAKPKLAELQDTADWRALLVGESAEGDFDDGANSPIMHCKKPRQSNDCNAVQSYLSNHPAGLHLAEAQRILKASGAKIASLRRQEEVRQRAETPISQMCELLGQQSYLDKLERSIRRVDAASGTENPYQRRQLATGRITIQDQRKEVQRELNRIGYRFNPKRDCEQSGSEQ